MIEVKHVIVPVEELDERIESALARILPGILNKPEEVEWITPEAARKMLNVCKTQFWILKSQNLFDVSKMSRKRELIRRSSVLKYIESHTNKF